MQLNSNELKSFYAGVILGDGTIDKGVHKRSLTMASIQKDFVTYLDDFTKQYTNFETFVKEKNATVDKNGVNHKKHWIFGIRAHPYFNKIYHQFYDDYRKKYINKEILNVLDFRGLANWYMGDGYITLVGKESNNITSRRVQLCTDCFTKSDNELIASWLSEKFGYDTSIIKRQRFYRINIKLKSAQNFLMDIKDFILPCFYYKLDLKFETKPNWMRNDYFEFMLSLNQSASTLKV